MKSQCAENGLPEVLLTSHAHHCLDCIQQVYTPLLYSNGSLASITQPLFSQEYRRRLKGQSPHRVRTYVYQLTNYSPLVCRNQTKDYSSRQRAAPLPNQKKNLDDTIEYKSMDPELISYIQDAIKESSQSLLPDLFKNTLQQITSEIATLREEVNTNETDIAELQEQVDTLTNKCNNMETTYDDLEQEARSSSIILLNQWEAQPAELPMTMAKNYIQEALNIDIFVKCFRLGRKSRFERNVKPRPILVKFATVSLKTEVLLTRRRTRKFVSDRYHIPYSLTKT